MAPLLYFKPEKFHGRVPYVKTVVSFAWNGNAGSASFIGHYHNDTFPDDYLMIASDDIEHRAHVRITTASTSDGTVHITFVKR